MNKITKEAAYKLQKILSKRKGKELSEEELELAYYGLMGFAEALIDLSEPQVENPPEPPKRINKAKLPIAKDEYLSL